MLGTFYHYIETFTKTILKPILKPVYKLLIILRIKFLLSQSKELPEYQNVQLLQKFA